MFEMKIFALNNLEPMDDLTFRKLLTNIPDEKQEIIKKFTTSDDAKRVLLADILIRSVVASELKVSSKIIEFNSNKYGKLLLREIPDFILMFHILEIGLFV